MEFNFVIILIITYILISINSFLVGYIVGIKSIVSDTASCGSTLFNKNNKSVTKQSVAHTQDINIDESKVVVSITTDNLQKKYDQLGEVKQSSENISSSIDRLKHLKK